MFKTNLFEIEDLDAISDRNSIFCFAYLFIYLFIYFFWAHQYN